MRRNKIITLIRRYSDRLSLAVKVRLILLSAFFLFFLAALAASVWTLKDSFLAFQRKEADAILSSAQLKIEDDLFALTQEVEHLPHHLPLSDLFDPLLAEERRAEFQSQLSFLEVDEVMILDSQGEVVFTRGALDSPGALSPELSTLLAQELAPIRQELRRRPREDAESGLFSSEVSPAQLHFVASSALYSRSDPSQLLGYLLLIDHADKARLAHYAGLLGAPFRLERMQEEPPPNGELTAEARGYPGMGRYQLAMGAPPSMVGPFKTGATLIVANLLAAGLLGLLLIEVVIKRVFIRRVSRFAKMARSIQQSHNIAFRLPVDGADEIDQMAMGINGVLQELQKTQEQLAFDALHDPLTGLGNRALIIDRLDLANSHLERDPEYNFVLCLIDLDGFKDINDGFGHNAGDYVLRVIADRLRSRVRAVDVVVRLGGDEFVILQAGMKNFDFLDNYLDQLIADIGQPIPWEEQSLNVTASVGVLKSSSRREGCSSSELLRDADIAMYNAKRSGRNQWSYFVSEQRNQATRKVTILQNMKFGLDWDEFEMWYQPIVHSQTRRVESLEALVRWRHPERGLISPSIFLPIAEESQIITQIDRWVLTNALAGFSRVSRLHPTLRISVNLNVKALLQPDILEILKDTIAQSNVSVSAIGIEITETAFAKNENLLDSTIRTLSSHGMRFYLDDFGTGYSSLGRLSSLPVQLIKIDQSFVTRLENGDGNIVAAIIDMAHALGKQVVAEGVENGKQADILEGMRCDFLQGYYFGKPMPEAQLLDHLGAAYRFTRASRATA